MQGSNLTSFLLGIPAAGIAAHLFLSTAQFDATKHGPWSWQIKLSFASAQFLPLAAVFLDLHLFAHLSSSETVLQSELISGSFLHAFLEFVALQVQFLVIIFRLLILQAQGLFALFGSLHKKLGGTIFENFSSTFHDFCFGYSVRQERLRS